MPTSLGLTSIWKLINLLHARRHKVLVLDPEPLRPFAIELRYRRTLSGGGRPRLLRYRRTLSGGGRPRPLIAVAGAQPVQLLGSVIVNTEGHEVSCL